MTEIRGGNSLWKESASPAVGERSRSRSIVLQTTCKSRWRKLWISITLTAPSKDTDTGDGVTFEIKEVSNIMDEMEYPGIRFTMNAVLGKLITPMKIDISTGDAITPRAVEFSYKLLLEDRSISLWTYNLETILVEKLQTVLARGVLNTRMRDFYDIKTLLDIYEQKIDEDVLKAAFDATCRKRGTENLKTDAPRIIASIESDGQLYTLWETYQKKYPYAAEISFADIMESTKTLSEKIR